MGLARYVARYLPGLLSRYLPGGGNVWTPALWFLANEQGIWLDPSDFTRYMADKGPELSQDLSFDDTSKWNKGSGWSVTGGQAVHNGAAADYVNSLFNPEVGKTYQYVVDIAEIPAGSNVIVYCNGVSGPVYTTPGVYTVTIFCSQAGVGAIKHSVRASNATGGTTRINSFSIKEVISASTATMFQDSAGTTPVTAVEQPVGLALDKRLGLVLGAETVPGTALTSTAGWSVTGCTVAIVGSELEITSTGAGTVFASLNIGAVSGAHKITASYRNGQAAGTTRVGCWTPSGVAYCTATASQTTVSGSAINTVGRQDIFVVLEATAAGQKAYVSAVSIKSLAGNHASQATTAQKPVLSARKNLLTYSEDFSNAAWTKQANAAITANSAAAPDGTTTADTYTSSGASDGLFATISGLVANEQLATIIRVKKGTGRWLRLQCYDGTNGYRVWVDTQTSTIGTSNTVGAGATLTSAAVAALADGWMQVTLVGTAPSTLRYVQLNSVTADASSTQASGTYYVWGAHTERGATVAAYQRVTTNTDYDTVGFPHYLKFDGVDDNLTFPLSMQAMTPGVVMAGMSRIGNAVMMFDPVSLSSSFIGAIENGSGVSPTGSNVVAGSYRANGTGIASTRGDMATALPTAVPATITFSGWSSIASWTDVRMGYYAGFAGLNNLNQLIIRGAATADLTPGEAFVAAKL